MDNKNITSLEEAILKVVMYWSDKLRNAHSPENSNNGDKESMATLLKVMGAMQNIPSDEQLSIFEKELTELLKGLTKEANPYYWILDCDYNPCALLSDASRKAKINALAFPWKTYTRIEPVMEIPHKFLVKVSCGYGTPQTLI